MRYLIQLLIPALIVIGVIYLVMRGRSRSEQDETSTAKDGDKGMFIFILVVGACVAIGVIFALQGFWDIGP